MEHHPSDTTHYHQAWIRPFVRSLAKPVWLESSLLARPRFESMRTILTIVQKRMHYLQQQQQTTKTTTKKNNDNDDNNDEQEHENDDSIPPPLRVVVFGGSVTEGTGCEGHPKHLVTNNNNNKRRKPPPPPTIRGKSCSWPFRLQQLANAVLGESVIEIVNVAVGGTNSDLAGPVLKYNLYPSKVLQTRGPHVIVNAYAVNDNLPQAPWRDNSTHDFRHDDYTLARAQTFIRNAMESLPCPTTTNTNTTTSQHLPMIVFVNDYLGNQNDIVLGEDIRHANVQLLSHLYGVGYISPFHPVSSLVYSDTTELTFSPPWTKGENYTKQVNGHFQMPGHIYMALSIAYSALKVAQEVCISSSRSSSSGHGGDDTTTTSPTNKDPHVATTRSSPWSIAPWLTRWYTLAGLATEWDDVAHNHTIQRETYCENTGSASPKPLCPFAFVATPAGTARTAGQLNSYLERYIVSNTGWKAENDMRNGWQNKLGLVAHTTGAKLKLRLPTIESPIRVIQLQNLKSYGDKWEGSNAQYTFTVWKSLEDAQTSDSENPTAKVQPIMTKTFQRSGFHDLNVSIAYQYKLDLLSGTDDAGDDEDDDAEEEAGDGPLVTTDTTHVIDAGTTVDIELELIGGTEYKLISLLLCSR